jgi:predicted ATP-binding protein involved in virulence
MRIDRLDVENFKCFAKQEFLLHPQMTVFVGENGTGKTAVLDALAVAASVWLVRGPEAGMVRSGREIRRANVRVVGRRSGDRLQFVRSLQASVSAFGDIGGQPAEWSRSSETDGVSTRLTGSLDATKRIEELYRRDTEGERILFPVLAYYGAGRAWLPSREPLRGERIEGSARRWKAFDGCFDERIRFWELAEWFRRETVERGNRGGSWRPGFGAVRRAVLGCVPGAEEVWLDADWDQIVMSIGGTVQPMGNLSAGQRMMLALVADLAIKCVTQNAYLITEEDPDAVLRLTPGVVLIDELDVHLHPKWQRRVAGDLKRTFPAIQFVCTTHSPQIIGELQPEEIRILSEGKVYTPPRSFGIDSNGVLEGILNAPSRDEAVSELLARIFRAIDLEKFGEAKELLRLAVQQLGDNDPDVTRANVLMQFLEAPE